MGVQFTYQTFWKMKLNVKEIARAANEQPVRGPDFQARHSSKHFQDMELLQKGVLVQVIWEKQSLLNDKDVRNFNP